MRVYYDTEFIEGGYDHPIDLISIGMVREDGAEYYAQSCEFNPYRASTWVQQHVFPALTTCPYEFPTHYTHTHYVEEAIHMHLPIGKCTPERHIRGRAGDSEQVYVTTMVQTGHYHECPYRTREQLRSEVRAFIDGARPNIELWGYYSSYDHVALAQLFDTMMDLPQDWPMYTHDIKQWCDALGNPRLPEQGKGEHNALADAHWVKQAYEFLAEKEQALYDVIAAVVQTNGTAHCYDRYTRDDDWTYCIFCEEGEFDPHETSIWHWKHKLDCPLFVLRKVLDHRVEKGA